MGKRRGEGSLLGRKSRLSFSLIQEMAEAKTRNERALAMMSPRLSDIFGLCLFLLTG
jgi:hypothetical protein